MKSIFEKLIENIENNYSINFEIKKTTWMESKYFAKQIDVFWVKIFATKKVGDNKIKHAATIMAEYLDSDENRVIDNPALIEKLKEQKAALIMFYDENDSENFFERESSDEFLEKYEVQDLYDVETRPNWFPHNKKSREFDASIEEIFHLISSKWYSLIYNEHLWENDWSFLSMYMDIARWNTFYKIPQEYPEEAWYTYYDETCDYNCQLTEYFYWAFTSYLWGQDSTYRYDEIQDEWQLNTKEKLKQKDEVYNMFENIGDLLPNVLPDWEYR